MYYNHMKRMNQKNLLLLLPLSFVLFIVLACGSTPGTPVPTEPVSHAAPVHVPPTIEQVLIVEQVPVAEPVSVIEQVFDVANVSDEIFEAVMEEVKALINNLNTIIRARNYTAWLTHLSYSYYTVISSRAFLEERTEELFRRDQIVARNLGRDPRLVSRRVLNTPRDFFEHIVVPSRSNDRVDDIYFISETRVIAFTIDTRGNRLILYNLERIDGNWRIIS